MEESNNKVIKLGKFAKKYWKQFSLVFMVISFALFICKVRVNHIKTIEMADALPRWYEQLPQSHWIKQDDEFNDSFWDLMHIEHDIKNCGQGLFNLSLIGMEQSKDYAVHFFQK